MGLGINEVARDPKRDVSGIDVGGVNGVEAMIDEGIEYLEASLLVDRPPENIAAEDEWRNFEERSFQVTATSG